MENQSREKKRVSNIIWNASEDYSFLPDFEVYDGKGEAQLYWNYIVGAVHKYYDYSRLQRFFSDLKTDPDHVFYESLAWLGLENCTYEKGRKDRPVLEYLRRSYALKVVRKEDPPSFYFLVDEIKMAHFQRALGGKPILREQVLNILNDLEFHESMNTEQIIQKMDEIIRVHFPQSPNGKKKNLFKRIIPRSRKLHFEENRSSHFPNPFHDTSILSLFNTGSTDFTQANNFFEEKETPKKIWRGLKEQWDRRQREYIQHYYGTSIFPASTTKALEQMICVENHRNCHLHFTRGEYDANTITKVRANSPLEVVLNQREKNITYYRANIARNSHSIEKLTSVIRNTMLVTLESSRHPFKAGSLVAGKVWRNVYLHDDKVFLKNVMDEIGNLTVDILLDASGSQLDRQEIIATEGFIIAESLTRCRIPVKMYSFCTNRNFTVINLFRDYDEVKKNDMVFHYHASGCNRDGLAVRTALNMINDSPAEHKVLIILSDGKPLDPQGIPASNFDPDQYMYADAPGINDTAFEVRKGWRNGVSILCAFTGAEADIPAAKRMYGNNLVCINTPDKFAEMVGILIRNVFNNL